MEENLPNTRSTSPEVVRSILIADSIHSLLDPERSKRLKKLLTMLTHGRPHSEIKILEILEQLQNNSRILCCAMPGRSIC